MTAAGKAMGKAALAAALLLGLAACQRPDPAAIRASIAQTDFSTAEQALIVADFETAGAVGVLGKAGRNGTVESWQSPDGVGLSLDRGVLVRTAGTGQGLLIADATGTRAALAGQGGENYRKLYKHLTGDNQIAEMLFSCTLLGGETASTTRAGRPASARHWRESCSSASTSIVNDYWTDSGSDIVKSRQWINPVAGYVTIDVPIGVPR